VKHTTPTTQLTVKTLLNLVQHFAGFVYRGVRLIGTGNARKIEVHVEAHVQSRPCCGSCRQPCPGYDRLEEGLRPMEAPASSPADLRTGPNRSRFPAET